MMFLLQLLIALADAKPVKAPVTTLHPTQFAVGMREVGEKENELKELPDSDPKELEKLLKKKAIPIVVGPGLKNYLLDHHHFGLAVSRRGIDEVYIDVQDDWRKFPEADFWKKMKAEGRAYLIDEKGASRGATELPDSLTELADDPYRSLAYYVRERGGFKKTSVPYAENHWAQFFRSRVSLGTTDAEFRAAIPIAEKLAHSPEAHDLPGYIPGSP